MSDKYYVVGRGRGRGCHSTETCHQTYDPAASVNRSLLPHETKLNILASLSVTDVYVGKGKDHPALYCHSMSVSQRYHMYAILYFSFIVL